jgi:CSLREA domain-containing protein
MYRALVTCWLVATPSMAATLVVNDTDDAADAVPGDGVCLAAGDGCTLRAAVEEANALPGLDVVMVPAGAYDLDLGTLFVTDSLRVLGPLAGAAVLDGQGDGSVLDIGSRRVIRVELHRLTIQGGNAQAGGGLVNRGAVVLVNRSTVRGNTAFSEGGGIVNAGVMAIVRSVVTDNGDPLLGDEIGLPGRSGGIENDDQGVLFLDRSTVSNNRANRFGGMRNLGLLIATNSTISGNTGDVDTGGLVTTGLAFLNNVTIADNHVLHVEEGNDFAAGGVSNAGQLFFANSIVAGNGHVLGQRNDCFGTLTSVGYVLVQDPEGCDLAGSNVGLLTGVDPLLAPLAPNGGDTPTHAIAADSPARDAGNPAFPTGLGAACEPVDQRTRLRGVGPGVGRCDLGAYERNAIPGEVTTP